MLQRMIRTISPICRLAATLLAVVMVFAVQAPVHGLVGDAGAMASMEMDSLCETVTADQADVGIPGAASAGGGLLDVDLCCSSAACAAYALGGAGGGAAFLSNPPTYNQSPPVSVHVADIPLPKRPPRFL